MMKNKVWNIAALALAAAMAMMLTAGCRKDNGYRTEEETQLTHYYVNYFAYNMMDTYYLWNEEETVEEGMALWTAYADPVETVKSIRYKDSSGDDIDRWTQVLDDFDGFSGSVSGNTKTYGFDFVLYYADEAKSAIYPVVTLVYKGSPAQKAGIARGDVITQVNGKTLTESNYSDIISDELLSGDACSLTFKDGGSESLTAVEMYEDPVQTTAIFDCGGKKVAYLHYSSFTLDSCSDLVAVCKSFKASGAKELILDLRYNGGGYVLTEDVLASMLAPEGAVNSGEVFETEVYNSTLTEAWGDGVTRFSTEFSSGSGDDKFTLSTAGANIGIDKLYVIMSGGSASASESLICGLKPYLDITLVGEQSYGKFCSGIMAEGAEWYDDYKTEIGESTAAEGKQYADNWGIYVMISRYADKDGITLSMPDGLTPDYKVADDPIDGYPLGSPDETMLAKALALAGYSTKTVRASKSEESGMEKFSKPVEKPGFGARIIGRSLLPDQGVRK